MRNNAFNKRLTLLTLTDPEGLSPPEETARAVVWADVSDVGVTTKLNALAVGQELTLAAVMWRSEFAGYTHAEYGGTRYRIAQTGNTANPLHIKLFMERS